MSSSQIRLAPCWVRLLLAGSIAGAAWAAAPRSAHALPCPNIMFVLDQSGSMDCDPSGDCSPPTGQSMWALQEKAVKTVLEEYGEQIPFGLVLFESSSFDNAGCYSDTKIRVQPKHDVKAKILDEI